MSDGQETREDQLRHHVAELKEELERAKVEKKQIHHDKVREVKSIREAEQARALDQLEGLRNKLHKEKADELQEQREQLNREFQTKLKAIEKERGEEIRELRHSHDREKGELREHLRAELCEELEEKISSKYESDRRKMAHEMFEIEQRRSSLEVKNADLMEGDRNTTAVLRDVDKQHRSEIENLNKEHRLSLKKQMEELDALKRTLSKKDKELSKMAAVQAKTEADKDKLQDDIKRLKQAESWTRRSTTPPSLSPSSSMNDLVSKRERDMVVKNSELSFRVRTLEETVSQLKKDKSKLQSQLTESRNRLAPLEEHKVKLNHRINELNTSLRTSDKRIEKMSKAILELKSSKQQLEEETARQKKTLHQQMSQNSAHRTEKERLKSRNTSLSDKLERLKSENKDLEDRLSMSWPISGLSPHSPRPLSPTSSIDGESVLSSSAGSSLFEEMEQLQFDKNESQAKYDEMKSEYVSVSDKYKKLRAKYDELQGKWRHMQVKGQQFELLNKEHMDLQHELSLLRKSVSASPSHDVKRFETSLDSLNMELEEKESRICELEDFIVEQDEVAIKSEEKLKQENSELQAKVEELSMSREDIDTDSVAELNERVSELERELEQATHLLQAKEIEIQQLQENVTATSGHSGDLSEPPSSPLTAAQLEHCISRYKTEIMELEKKNSSLQINFEDAIAQVTQLQGMTFELEGRLQEDEKSHQEVVAGRDDEIDVLNERLSQLETKLIKINRALPVEDQVHPTVGESHHQREDEGGEDPTNVSEEELKQLADEVFEAVTRVKQTSDQKSLRAEISTLEDVIRKLVCSILPDYAPVLPSSSPPGQEGGEEEEEQPSSSLSESTPSSSLLEISSDFTALPLTYEKVLTPPRDQPAWTPGQATPQGTTRHYPFDDRSENRASLEQVDSSMPTSSGPTDSLLYQTIFGREDVHEKPQVNSVSSQTSQLISANRFTQTPPSSREKLAVCDSSSQTSAVRMATSSSQTVTARQPVARDKSSQTQPIRKPRVMEQASQTTRPRKPITVDRSAQTQHSQRSRMADKSSQTWSSPRRPLEEREVVSLVSPHVSDWDTRLVGTVPVHSSPMSPAVWSIPSPVAVTEEGKQHRSKPDDDLPRVFVVVMDYDPNSLCTTGRPELELSLRTGDVVSVEGEMDEDGFYHASFGGEKGLVPANFVQETEVTNLSTRERLFNQSLTHNLSTVSTPVKSQQTSPMIHYVVPKATDTSSPQCPLSLRVERVVGRDSVLVAWQPPPMDSMCHSNGCLVTGYQIYVNKETNMLVSGAHQSKAVVAGVSVGKTLYLGISTSSVEGKSSKVMEIEYHGRPVSITSTSPEPESVSTYVALYDYNPLKHSPSDHPEFELGFKQGDIILVSGQEKDGFLVGELNGRQGLVPATFVSQVSGPAGEKATLSPSKRPRVTSRKLRALYDYDPVKMSPNPNSDVELAFKTGDIITIYGDMQGDGFYSGELDGRCGLVPSNFLIDL